MDVLPLKHEDRAGHKITEGGRGEGGGGLITLGFVRDRAAQKSKRCPWQHLDSAESQYL